MTIFLICFGFSALSPIPLLHSLAFQYAIFRHVRRSSGMRVYLLRAEIDRLVLTLLTRF